MSELKVLSAIIFFLGTTYYFYLRSLRFFPPGPRGLPLIGCVLSMPKEMEWLTYVRWGKEYGDMIGLNVVGHKLVVLNSPELVRELFERRGGIYSDRPRIPMLDMVGMGDLNMGLMPYGSTWRTCRKLLLQAMTPQLLDSYVPIQEREVYKLIQDLLISPDVLHNRVKRTAGAIVMSIFLGYRVNDDDDPFIKLNDDHIEGTNRAGSFSEYLVNTLPSLRHLPPWFPGTHFKQEAEEGLKITQQLYEFPLKLAKQRIDDGDVVPCFMNSVLETGENILEGQAVAATVYTAGGETTVSVLETFVLAMTLYPSAQKKAQAEITQAIGTQRLPRIDDREKVQLPFVEALIKETYRWNPPASIGVPHLLMKEDEVEGYLLPRGTTLLPNIWGILHDDTRYPRPLEFYPERYLVPDPPEDPREHVFGYGRRVCPGRTLADRTVWLTIVSMLAAFDITPDIDEKGEFIKIIPEYTTGVFSRPKPFRYKIKPRYATLEDSLAQTITAIEDLGLP